MLNPVVPRLIYTDDPSVICEEETMRSLGFPLSQYNTYLTCDTLELEERQKIFRDMLENSKAYDLIFCLMEQLELLSDLARKAGGFETDENEGLLYSIKELLVFTETIDLMIEKSEGIQDRVTSKRLVSLVNTFQILSKDAQYLTIKEWLLKYASSLKNLQSITIGVNLDAQLNAKEVGIVSFNETPYVIGGLMRRQSTAEEFTCLTVLGIKETGLTEKNAYTINREFYYAINKTLKRSIRSIKKLLNDQLQKTIYSLISLRDELTFLIKCANYFRNQISDRIPHCFPKIHTKNTLIKLYNPLLLGVCAPMNIIPNSVTLDEQNRIFILTGPNSGGKTSFIQSLGIAWLFFQLGLPVTAKQANMKPFERIVTHFVEKSVKQSEGRLANEAARLRQSIGKIQNGNTLFLLDETFSGTNSYDALLFSEALIKHLSKLKNCYAVYITHLLELNDCIIRLRQGEEFSAIHLMTAGIKNGKRSYEIVPYQPGIPLHGFAKEVIVENGLGFLFDIP